MIGSARAARQRPDRERSRSLGGAIALLVAGVGSGRRAALSSLTAFTPHAARAALAALAALTAAGCGGEQPVDTRPLVAVSVPPQAFVVERLAGDRVRIEIMVPPGASPATYEPTMRQLRALEEVRIYVAVAHPAFPFESSWLDPLLSTRPGLTLVTTAEPNASTDEDPHVWVTPGQIDALATRLATALVALLPEARDEIAASLEALHAEIAAVDATLRDRLDGAPGRRFLVMHGAWGHLADAYGLEQVAIERGHKAPDARLIGELIEAARAGNAKVVFVQPQFDATAATLVAGEVGAEVVVLDPLARDWPTNMRQVADALVQGLY